MQVDAADLTVDTSAFCKFHMNKVTISIADLYIKLYNETVISRELKGGEL